MEPAAERRTVAIGGGWSLMEGDHMKKFSATVAALAVLLTAGSAVAQKVTTDHDPSGAFASYKTYAWTKGTESTNPLGEKRIHDGVDAKMAAAGFKAVTESPDVYIATHAVAKEQKELQTTGYGYGPRWGGGMGTATVNTYLVGTLVLDIYDARTKQLVWRGIATDTLSDKPEKNAEKVAKSLEKMFKEYPPKVKK
jgi:hypothetical protein